MAEGIVYLDVDDEITSAAARIRSAAGTKVALVVPYGSRIATSRMNFRLLSREAVMSNRRLSIVSGDAASRSLAASAGLPVFATVGEYESAIGQRPSDGEAGEAQPAVDAGAPAVGAAAAGAAAVGGAAAAASLAASETVVTPAPTETPARKSQRPKRPVATEPPRVAAPPPPPPPPRERVEPDDDRPSLPPLLGTRVRAPLVAAIALLVLALLVAGVAGYVFLPSASITLVPRQEAIPAISITVSADPEATEVDVQNAVVPADRVPVPVEASGTFTTTGTHVEESAAKGQVTFTNYDTSSGVSIASGSIVSTEGGVRFRTTRTVVLQPAGIIPFEPKSDSTGVTAVKAGEAGNVPANTIRVVPQGQNPDLLKVNNPNPTSGGTHTETPEIAKAEVDKAVAELRTKLTTAFSDAVANGAGAPADTKLFPETAVIDVTTAVSDPDPASLIGQAVETFDLKLTATGTVIAVDPRPVASIAEVTLDSRVSPDHRLVEGSTRIDVGDGSVGEDGQVTFLATATARQVAIVDPATLPALVKGHTAADAKAALAPFGDATVTIWPDWASTITTIDARLSIVVDDDAGTVGPDGSPAPSSAEPSAP